MHKYFFSNFAIHIVIATLIGCDGDLLFRTKACDDGTVRDGNACVVQKSSEITASKESKSECKDPNLNYLKKGELITLCDGSLGEGKYIPPSEVSFCSKDGEQDCVVKSGYKAVELSKLDASKIAFGSSIAGTTGTMRSSKNCRNYSSLSVYDASYPNTTLGWGIATFLPAAVDLATDQIAFSSDHGVVTNSPIRFTSTLTLPAPLVSNTTYYAIYVSNTALRLSNTVNGAAIDLTSQGTGTHTAHDVPDSVAQYFDTVEDYNNNLASSPSNNPWSSSDFLCDSSNFVNVTSTASPLLPSGTTPPTGNRTFTQIWQDQLTGMYVSNILYVSGGGRIWTDAIRTCEALNGGTAGEGWHLPTHKQLLQLYVNGISKVPLAGGSLHIHFWSSTTVSTYTRNSWTVQLSNGYSYNDGRTNGGYSVICVR